jgi:hypothetical protein
MFTRAASSNTQRARWYVNGDLLIGQQAANQSNVFISAGKLELRNNTTASIELLATADAAGHIANFLGVIGIGASGGIWQGSSGTFASPNTGLKIYRSSSKGIWESWDGGTKEVYIEPSDMSLRAAAGNVRLNSSGLDLIVPGTETKRIRFLLSDLSDHGSLSMYGDATNSTIELAAFENTSTLILSARSGSDETFIRLRNDDTIYFSLSATYYHQFTDASVYFGTPLQITGNLTGVGRISAGSGSVGSPTYRFTNDGDTGIYLPATGKIGIAVGGVDKVFVDTYGMSGWWPFTTYSAGSSSISGDNTYVFSTTLRQGRSWIVRAWRIVVFVESPNNGSNYWTVHLVKQNSSGTFSSIHSFNTSGDSAATWLYKSQAPGDTLASSDISLFVRVNKTGSPGNVTILGPLVWLE